MNFSTKKPNLFIVGAPKAGTTALYHYLKKHPDIFLSDLKEPNYFSYEAIKKQNLYYKTRNARNDTEYVSLFSDVEEEKIIGEGSVSYLFYKEVPQKIYEFNTDSHIIILLRNPVQRAYSHYLMDKTYGLISLEFEEVLYKKTNHKYSDLYYQQYIELGYYAEQIKRYLNLFGPQVKIYLTEDLKNNREEVLTDIFDTLGVPDLDISKSKDTYNNYKRARSSWVSKLYSNSRINKFIKASTPPKLLDLIRNMLFEVNAAKPKMDKTTKDYLEKLYLPHILCTEKLIGRKLEHWYH